MIYIVKINDTFDTISRRVYGLEDGVALIRQSNPGVTEPLVVGAELVIPDRPGTPQIITPAAPSDALNEVVLTIGGTRFRVWESISITRSIDSMDVIGFTAPFEADNQAFKDTFEPFSYKPIEVAVGGVTLFRGKMLNITPELTASRKTVQVEGYSTPGVLNDCPPPAGELDKLDFTEGSTLESIATAVAAPFGISVVFASDTGAAFKDVTLESSKKVLSFLTDLAKQRNLVISSTQLGDLLFWRSVEAGSPVAILNQGSPPLVRVVPEFNPQRYYSHITGLQSAITGFEGSAYTIANPHLKGVVRPFTFKAEDTGDGDIKTAVEAKIGRMFGGAVKYFASMSTWRDPSGNLWSPNTTIALTAPEAMIYSQYEFLIKSVTFNKDAESETATLELVLPGAFSGEIPESLPWAL